MVICASPSPTQYASNPSARSKCVTTSLWPVNNLYNHNEDSNALITQKNCHDHFLRLQLNRLKRTTLSFCTHVHILFIMITKVTVTFLDWPIDINYTISLKNITNFHTNMLSKYHWFSMNSWPPGLRLSPYDVHNSLNTDPLLLLSVGGQANSVKSKIISSPINNQLQNCRLSDRPEKPRKEVAI